MARSLTIFMRHEPALELRRRLEGLQVHVIVDRDAPACSIALGGGDRREPCSRCLELDQRGARAAADLAVQLRRRARADNRR